MSLEIQHGKNRTIHKAVIAPLCHEIELIADKRFLGATRYGELDTARYTHGTPQHEPVFPFEGAYAEYATIEGRVDAAAAEQFLDSLFSNDQHPLRPIWEAYQDIAPQFAVSEQKVRGFNRPLDPIQALRRITTYLGEHTILSFVMPTAFYYRHTQNLSGTRLTEKLLSKSEQLAWASTLSRNVREISSSGSGAGETLFPGPGVAEGTTEACPFVSSKRSLFYDDIWSPGLWNRPYLRHGPREFPGYCPLSSSSELDPRTRSHVNIVTRMLRKRGVPNIVNREKGVASGSELHLIRSITLLGQTVFKTL
jgi:hypothetical protein